MLDAPFRAGATHAVHFRPVAVAYVQDQVVSDGGEVSNRLRRPAGKSGDRRGRSDRQRASIPGGRPAGAAIAPGLARKSANPRLSIADSFPDLARGDARLADRGIRSLRSSTPRRSRCGRRRTPVQHVVIRMIKFECPRLLDCSLGKRRSCSQSRKSYRHCGNLVSDHIACSVYVRET